MCVSRSQRPPFTAAAYMRESAAFVCDVWCDTFEMFSLTLHFDNSTILTRYSLSLYTSLLRKLLVVEQEVVLSAAVGHLLLGLDTNVEYARKKPLLLDFGDSRFSVICVIAYISP